MAASDATPRFIIFPFSLLFIRFAFPSKKFLAKRFDGDHKLARIVLPYPAVFLNS